MANIKSAKKDIKSNEKNRQRNIAYKSKLRTAMKAVRVAVEKKDEKAAQTSLTLAISIIDRAVTKGIETKGTASRQKSELQLAVNSLKK